MDEPTALSNLRSRLPSRRIGAIRWLTQHPSPVGEAELREALGLEAVPTVRRHMELALEQFARARDTRREEADHATEDDRSVPVGPDSFALDKYFAGLVRHETEPVIGWLRRSATRELGAKYESSETAKNIEVLRGRLDGVTSLLTARKAPEWKSASIVEEIHKCMPPDLEVDVRVPPESLRLQMDMDEALFALIVGNALKNAQEASRGATTPTIEVECSVELEAFRVRISNTYRGSPFELEDVVRIGASTKSGNRKLGRGLGLAASQAAAARLNWAISLEGRGGVAVFTLKGPRLHAKADRSTD